MTERARTSLPRSTAVSGGTDGRGRGPSAPVFAAGLLAYGTAGMGLAAIGGWVGLLLVFLLVAAVIAGLIAVS